MPTLNEHIITKAQARDYIFNFIEKFFPGGITVIGGFISKIPFTDFGFETKAITYDGLLAWYCWDTSVSSLYLSFERDTQYDKDKPYEDFPSTSDGHILVRPKEFISIDRRYDKEEIERILLDGPFPTPKMENRSQGATVRPMVAAAKQGILMSHNKFPIGFFSKTDFEKMLAQKGVVGIRYFFGYDSTLKENKIRIILVAVRDNFSNISTLADGSEGLFLERSWPPPPDTK